MTTKWVKLTQFFWKLKVFAAGMHLTFEITGDFKREVSEKTVKGWLHSASYCILLNGDFHNMRFVECSCQEGFKTFNFSEWCN